MKKSSIKLVSIFILFLFCLAPLSAIDLNQDNNTKCINQDNEIIAVDDSNITADNETVEIAVDDSNISDNENIPADDSNITAGNETVEIEDNDNQNQSFESRSPDLLAIIMDVPYGNNPIVHVYADDELNGRISINCPDFENSYKVPMQNGRLEYQLKEDLHPGTYYVKIAYGGDSVFEPQEITEKIIVYKANPYLKVNADDVVCDKNVTVNIRGNEYLNDTVELKLNNSRTYQVEMVDGKGQIVIDDLGPGKYKASVVFNGNELFESGLAESEFTVLEKYNPNMSLKVDDCSQSDTNLHAVVHADERFTGNVTIKINGRVYFRPISVVDGYGEGYYPSERYPGNYTVVASTEGNDLFYAENCSTTYIVKDI